MSAIENLIELDTVGSTNDHAKDLAKSGYPHGTVVRAHHQTAGRGRQGNIWVSKPGNLYMTLVLRPDNKNAAVTGQLSFVAAVALGQVLRDMLPQAEVSLKWPNDVLVNGKKIAGILLETQVDGVRPVSWVVIGMGVNVTDAPEGATAVHFNGAREYDAAEVMERVYVQLMALYADWHKNGFTHVRETWLSRAHNLGGVIHVRLPKETFTAKFLGIDTSGALELEMDDGKKRTVASGEVFAA